AEDAIRDFHVSGVQTCALPIYSDASMGYGYQWWIPEGDEQDYCAIGILNQFMCISPKHDTVIVKLSASRTYASAGDETSWREYETIELFREIARNLD